MSTLLGANFCLDKGDTECGTIGPGFAFNFDFFWRFLPYLSVDIDFFVGTSTNDGAHIMSYRGSTIGFLIGPTAYLPIGPVDIALNAAVGWSRNTTQTQVDLPAGDEDQDVNANAHGVTIGWAASVSYRFVERFSLGVMFRHTIPFMSEACTSIDREPETCVDDPGSTQEMRIGLYFAFYFYAAESEDSSAGDSDAPNERFRPRGPSGPGLNPLEVRWELPNREDEDEELIDDE